MRREMWAEEDMQETLRAAGYEEGGQVVPRAPRWSAQVARRLVRNPSATVGASLLALVVVAVCLAPILARYPPALMDINTLNGEPSVSHWFGTDFMGRDVWSRVLYGGRLSIAVGLGVLAIEFTSGVTLGCVAGHAGGAIDSLIMRLMDILLTVPGILLALGIVSILGEGLRSVVIALGIAGIPGYARMARAMTLKVRNQDYVSASCVQGWGMVHVVRYHILPNVADPLLVMATTSVGGAVLAASALSYLGVGAQGPAADWGALLSEGYEHMYLSPCELLFPGIAVSLTVLGTNLLGDALTDALNPQL